MKKLTETRVKSVVELCLNVVGEIDILRDKYESTSYAGYRLDDAEEALHTAIANLKDIKEQP